VPRPEEKRKERLNELLLWAKYSDMFSYNVILRKARNSFPFLTDKTIIDYAKTVTRLRKLSHEVSN